MSNKAEKKWTYGEFVRFITNKVIEENPEFEGFLDYCQAYFEVRDRIITSEDTAVKTVTEFGGSEGVYTVMLFSYPNNGEKLGSAKTLDEGNDAFRKMSKFACEFTLSFNSYIENNSDEFNYEGYSVGRKDEDGTVSWHLWCEALESAISYAKKSAQRKNATYVVRNNATRAMVEEVRSDANA